MNYAKLQRQKKSCGIASSSWMDTHTDIPTLYIDFLPVPKC